MASFNNPNLPLGMMHQVGFINSSGQMAQQPHNPNFNAMNQMPTGPGSTPGGGQQGMQYSMQQSNMPVMSPALGMNPGMMGHQSPAQQSQQQPMHQNPVGPGGPRSAGPASVDSTQTGAAAQTGGQNPQQPPQSKELNPASLCRFGQETVQEIVSRAQEVFQTLRTAQPPDGKQVSPAMDRKPKFQETLRNIRALFKRLRVIHEKMEEGCPASDDSYFEDSLPFKGGSEVTVLDERKNTEAYRLALEEYREMIEQVMVKNRHLKETVDHLRQIIWDINTMLAMRKE